VRSPGFEGKPLSVGQLAALRLAASGYTSRQIAAHLDTTEQGVHLRLKEAAVRLGARSRTHAVVIAIRRRLIDLGDVEMPSTVSKGPRAGTRSPQGASEASGGARDVRGATRAAEGRSGGPRGAAA
jgi:DNA-binding CsgD family transcriptional regulator